MRLTASGFGWAWVAAGCALALHVADEATHDFLAWYNPRALRIRQAIGWRLPFPPTFTFWPWLLGLSVAVGGLAILTPLAFAGARWVVRLATVVAIVHVCNGLFHVAGTIRSRRAVPGVLSAPVLIVVGVWLWYAAGRIR